MAGLTRESYIKIILALILAALLFAVVGFGTCGARPFFMFSSPLSEAGNAEIAAQEIDAIDIDWLGGSVDITVSNSDKVILKERDNFGNAPGQEMRWQLNGRTLKIDYGTSGISIFSPTKHLELSIPSKLARNLDSLKIEAASGEYHLEGLGCQRLDISLASGILVANDLKADILDVEIASGTARIDAQVSEKLDVEAASGDFSLNCREQCPSKVDVEVLSGSVALAIPDNEGFTLKLDRISGDFDTDFSLSQKGNSSTYKNGTHTINVNLVSGDFRLSKNF